MPDATYAQSIPITDTNRKQHHLGVCSICGALVPASAQHQHTAWHNQESR